MQIVPVISSCFLFQSTLPRRSDGEFMGTHKTIGSFNPRSREGATRFLVDQNTIRNVSIHAPAKERHPPRQHLLLLTCFNPRSREGATFHSATFLSITKCFNPRSREGATAKGHNFLSLICPFLILFYTFLLKNTTVKKKITYKFLYFIQIFRCESLRNFMFTLDSHFLSLRTFSINRFLPNRERHAA